MVEALLRSYYAAYNSMDIETLKTILDPQLVLVSAVDTQAGREAYLATYGFMTSHFIDQMEPLSIELASDVATVHIRDELTARADIPDFMGHPVAKGQKIVPDLIGRYTVSKGKIARIEITQA